VRRDREIGIGRPGERKSQSERTFLSLESVLRESLRERILFH